MRSLPPIGSKTGPMHRVMRRNSTGDENSAQFLTLAKHPSEQIKNTDVAIFRRSVIGGNHLRADVPMYLLVSASGVPFRMPPADRYF